MNMLALTIIFPLIGFVLLAFSRGRWSENLSATVGIGSIGLAALVTAYAGIDFFNNGVSLSACRCGPGCRSVISTSVSTWCWMVSR
jgi:NADH:ubiquinone oxidoreductase subunit 5 (subunit L)/multisubunit Na+/H+ antiporter MnhA subunit